MAEDSAASVALNPAASAAERYDAQIDIHKSHGPRGLGDLIPSPEIQPVIDYINQSWQDGEFEKSIRKNVVPFPATNRGKPGIQSVYLDDFQVTAQGEYWERPGVLGFDSMRAMVDGTPILNSIILTRIRQVQRFCRVNTDGVGPGFKIAHVDKTAELGDEQQQSIQLLQHFMSNSGWELDPRKRKRLKRDSLAQFMAKSVRDTLTLDAAPIETEFKRDVSMGIDGFYAIDGATIRLCTEQGYQGDDEIFALQVVQGRVRTAYTYEDLVYEVRNPRTDVMACGYGMAETEMLIRVVTYMLNTMTYNGSFFDKNSMPRGMMNLYGNYSTEDIAAFKRYWLAMTKGIQNAWNMPVMVSKDNESKAEFVEIGGAPDEMLFGKWMSFLTSVACAIYGIAPEEISMESYNSGKSSLSGDDTGEKMDAGANNGKLPLLAYYESLFTDFIIRPFSEQYCFRWTGLDDGDAKTREENRKLILNVNEMRQEEGYDPWDGPLGKAPLNPALMAAWQAITPGMQPEQPAEDFGAPGEGDDEEKPSAPEGEDYGTPPEDEAEPAEGDGMAKALGLPDLQIHRIQP